MDKPFRILGIQQIAIGGPDKRRLQKLWVDVFGLAVKSSFVSERDRDCRLSSLSRSAARLTTTSILSMSSGPAVARRSNNEGRITIVWPSR